jgi:hypothetical protein
MTCAATSPVPRWRRKPYQSAWCGKARRVSSSAAATLAPTNSVTATPVASAPMTLSARKLAVGVAVS